MVLFICMLNYRSVSVIICIISHYIMSRVFIRLQNNGCSTVLISSITPLISIIVFPLECFSSRVDHEPTYSTLYYCKQIYCSNHYFTLLRCNFIAVLLKLVMLQHCVFLFSFVNLLLSDVLILCYTVWYGAKLLTSPRLANDAQAPSAALSGAQIWVL